MLTINHRQRFCVYEHLLDGAVMFCAAGTFAEAFDLIPSHRSPEWRKLLSGLDIEVRIISAHANLASAARAAKSRPAFLNSQRRVFRGDGPHGSIVVFDPSTGTVYPTLKDAACALGVSSGALSAHLSGRLKTIAGKILERANPAMTEARLCGWPEYSCHCDKCKLTTSFDSSTGKCLTCGT